MTREQAYKAAREIKDIAVNITMTRSLRDVDGYLGEWYTTVVELVFAEKWIDSPQLKELMGKAESISEIGVGAAMLSALLREERVKGDGYAFAPLKVEG